MFTRNHSPPLIAIFLSKQMLDEFFLRVRVSPSVVNWKPFLSACDMLGGRFPFTIALSNHLGSSKLKLPPGINPGITPGICLVRPPMVMTVTLNFSEG